MASDLEKTIAGALLFGASALTGNALLLALAGGVGVNWTSEGLVGLWQQRALKITPGTPLALAGERAIRRALGELRRAYRKQHGPQADTAAFELVAACASAAAAELSTADEPGITAQRAFAGALTGLLHGHEERQALFLERELLPATAIAFQAELDADADAWRGYQSQMVAALAAAQAAMAAQLQRLPEVVALLRDESRARQALANSYERLEAEIAALRAAILQLSARTGGARPVGKAYIESAVARDGGSATVRNDRSAPRRSEAISADELYDGSAIAEGPGSRALAENRYGASTSDPAAEPGRPPALVLTLQFTPTPDGAQVRWVGDEVGGFKSTFQAPYRGADLAAVLRALEQQQHPAFALQPAELARLAALGLCGADGALPENLAQRVGQALYTALISGAGIAALALAQRQAAQTSRPLAMRLLLPPEAVELAALPWELLWPTTGGPLLLSASPGPLLTRHLDLAEPLPPLAERRGRPLRILALTPHAQRAPDELAEIRAELAQLWATLRARKVAEVVEVSPVTRDDLARALRSAPDIVQFTGHGWYTGGRGVLMLDPLTPGAPADLVDADQAAVALRGTRMVLLTACRGAQGAGIEGGAESLLTGVAPALSAAGVPVVVGMQLGVRVTAALRACDAIYSALAEGLSAQAAVGRARDELYVLEQDRASWYVPTLYVRTREPGPVYL